jgi:hypothetical protein
VVTSVRWVWYRYLQCVCVEISNFYSLLSFPLFPSDRGLDFTAQALRRSVSDPSEELSVSFTKAYEASLRQYHNFVVKGAFGVSVSSVLELLLCKLPH